VIMRCIWADFDDINDQSSIVSCIISRIHHFLIVLIF
jgi:hypothetical protein